MAIPDHAADASHALLMDSGFYVGFAGMLEIGQLKTSTTGLS